MIPRQLHRVWIGDSPMPKEYEAFWKQWQKLHPDWSYHTWGEKDVQNVELYRELRSASAKSDLLRYEVLEANGGVYVDTDFEPLRPLDPLVNAGLSAFAAWEDENRVCTALMGAEAHHPAVQALVRELPKWARSHRSAGPDTQTGPVFLTKIWNGRHDVSLLPSVTFYPVSYWKRNQIGQVPYPECSFAVHHWGRSWMENDRRDRDDKSMHSVAILVPRKSDGGGPRDQVWRWLRPRWERNFPEADIVDGYSEPFSRAKSINAAAANHPLADVYVIADSDSWVSPAAVRTAIQTVEDYLIPWNRGYKLTEKFTKHLLKQDTHSVRLTSNIVQQNLEEPEHHHLSGIVVVTREAFEAVGGFDERFEGWGFEDTAFIYELDKLRDHRRQRGVANLIHFWHPPATDSGNPSDASVDLFNQIRAERGLKPWRRGVDR